MGPRLTQQRVRALILPLQHRLLGELAQVVRRDLGALELHGERQLVEHLECIRPVALRLVDPDQVIEGVRRYSREADSSSSTRSARSMRPALW